MDAGETEANSLEDGQAKPATPVQPSTGSLESSLEAFEARDSSRHLALLVADRALVDHLMWRGYRGPEWDRFSRALAEYGLAVLRAWIVTGAIFLRCLEKGIGRLPRAGMTREDAEEIAIETVAEAIKRFRDRVLVPGKWDMTRGATLKTYFIGQCVLRFPNVYRRWYREREDPFLAAGDRHRLVAELSALRQEPTPTEVAAELSRALGRFEPNDPLVILALQELGYTQREIAELLITTVRGIESRLFRHRRRASP